MKRSAEEQLNRTDDDERREVEDPDAGNPGQGFQKAADSVLATRKIKPLPLRAGSAGGPSKSLFSGFAASTPSNPFAPSSTTTSSSSLGPSTASSIPLPSSSEFFSRPSGDGSSEGKLVAPSASAFTPPPSTTFPQAASTSSSSPTATNTSKAFASILNAPSSNIFGITPSQPQTTASFAKKSSNGTTESHLTNYYTNIRGLNMSLLNFVKDSIERDPFLDLTSVFESYKTHRSKVQKKYDESSKDDKSKPSISSTLPGDSSFGSSDMKPPSAVSTSEPKPLTSGSIFGSRPASNSLPFPKSEPIFAGSATSSNSFSFAKPTNSSEPSNSKTSTAVFGSSITPSSATFFGGPSKPASIPPAFSSTTPSGFSFGAPKSPTTDTTPSTLTPTPTFGKSMAETSTTATGATSSSSSTKTPFSFFAPATSTTSNPFGLPATNLFGSSTSSTPAFGASADMSGSDKKPAPTIGFGSPSSVAKNAGVFFGFGSSPASTSTSASATPTPGAAEKESQETVSTEDGTGSEGTEPKEPMPGLLTPNLHDEEGAGEENEETVHAIKLKAYRMKKADEQGGTGWAELGMGILRLKKDKDTGVRRLLLRNSTNGKININFNIYAGLRPSISKKALTFVGHADGASQTYCVRLPSETQANELKEALEREIEFVKAKQSS